MTQRPPDNTLALNAGIMDPYRNNYEEVCVYCHTPHGANSNVMLPLWNRTLKATTYQTYNQLGTSTLTQTVSQPGANSLACLSCHDGQTAVDSIINMPGSGRYLKSQETATSMNQSFLDSWPLSTPGMSHMGMNSAECLVCHSTAAPFGMTLGSTATDFTIFAIGTDLRNDHPVGITYPVTSGTSTEFKTPSGQRGTTFFFDDGDNQMEKQEVRIYDSKVECASCHDPHGVPSGGNGSIFKPTFLRVANTASALCLTCHTK